MPFDASGVFTRIRGNDSWAGDATAGTKIRSDLHDQNDSDIANGLSECLTKTGKSLPVVDIAWGGFKLTNLGDPTNPQDAASKKYVDDRFSTAFSITGADDAGRINFSGSQSPLATGKPIGFSFVQADLFFGVKPANVESNGRLPRWVWNNQGNGMGTDVANMTDVGNFTTAGTVTAAGISAVTGTFSGALSAGTVSAASGTFSGNLSAAAGTVSAVNGSYSGSITATGNITSSSHITAAGNVSAGGSVGAIDVNASGNVHGANFVTASGKAMVFGNGGSGRLMQFSPQWYWDWNVNNGALTWVTPSGPRLYIVGSDLYAYGAAYKPGGGAWAASSDARIKDVHGPYEHGLDELLQVNPVRYNYKADPDREYIGVVAQEIEGIMPETVSLTDGEVDGQQVSDFRAFDSTALLYAAINAIKTLSARIEALEAQLAEAR